MITKLSICFVAMLFACPLQQTEKIHSGKVIPKFGKIATVDSDLKLTAETKLKISFDVAEKSRPALVNRTFDSAARFINLNVDSGADPKNVHVAIVVHGSAAQDVAKSEFYSVKNNGKENPNVEIIAELLKNGTTIYLCGQTAAWLDIKKEDLLPGIKIAPSAMTAHALLQQDEFALCPF